MTDYVKSIREYIGHAPLLLVGAGVFVYQNGRVLLQRRRDNGCWADNGGCMELGETPEETAARELFEETGLRAEKLEFLGIYSGKDMFYTYPNGDQVYIVGICYLCEAFHGEIKLQKDEVSELRWFDLYELPENISPPSRHEIDDLVAYIANREKSNDKNE